MNSFRKGWSAFSTGYVRVCFRKPLPILALFLIAAAAMALLAVAKIKVVTDLAALLPEGTPSVAALEQSRERIGSTDYFTIAIESDSLNPHHIAKAQDILARRIEAGWEDAKWVQVERETEFFRRHVLYYLPETELEDIRWRLERELISASAKAMPGMVDLLDSEEKTEEKDGIEKWYDPDLPRRLGLPSQVADVFESFFKNKDESRKEKGAGLPAELADRLIGPKGDVGVVLVQLEKPSTDLDYARWALERGQSLIRDIELENIAPGLRAEVVGAYRSFMEVDAVSNDGQVATTVSVILVVALIFVFFRSFRTVIAVVGPLVIAGSVTMGLAAVTYGRLTALTVFVLAMLVGMGIDYGIHLFGRTIMEFRRGRDLETATRMAIEETGAALLTAALTTIASMLTLLFAHFEGFAEFGIISSMGLSVCALVYILTIPPIVALLEKIRPMAREEARPPLSFGHFTNRRVLAGAFLVGVLLTVAGALNLGSVEFENDFRNLRAPGTKNKIRYGRAIGKDKGTTPAVILGSSIEEMSQVHQLLIRRLNEEKDPLLKSFFTLRTFVPEQESQKKRQEIIRAIKELVDKRAMRKVKGEKGRLISELRSLATAEPFELADLPTWSKMIVAEKDGSLGKVGHIHADVKDWDASSVREFQQRYGELPIDGKRIPVASSSFILSDVVAMVKDDGGRLLLLVSAALLFILAVFTRSVIGTILLTTAVVAAGIWTAGSMGILGIRLGLYNLIAMPVILGVGVDGAIHLYHSYRSFGPERLGDVLATTGVAVTASSLTTAAGFAGLFFVSHKGLQTIGQLAVAGVLLSYAAVVLIVPFLMEIAASRGFLVVATSEDKN